MLSGATDVMKNHNKTVLRITRSQMTTTKCYVGCRRQPCLTLLVDNIQKMIVCDMNVRQITYDSLVRHRRLTAYRLYQYVTWTVNSLQTMTVCDMNGWQFTEYRMWKYLTVGSLQTLSVCNMSGRQFTDYISLWHERSTVYRLYQCVTWSVDSSQTIVCDMIGWQFSDDDFVHVKWKAYNYKTIEWYGLVGIYRRR